VEAGEVPIARLEASLARIRRVKAALLLPQPDIDPDQVVERIGAADHQRVAAALREAANAA
jgi:hypothetical protein